MTKKNLITTTEFVDFEKAADILQKYKIEKLPVVDAEFKLVGLITYKDIIKIKQRPNACKDKRGRLRVAAAVGVASDTLERVKALVSEEVDAIIIDTAHGHTKGVIDIARAVKKSYPEIELIVGNIGTVQADRTDFVARRELLGRLRQQALTRSQRLQQRRRWYPDPLQSYTSRA